MLGPVTDGIALGVNNLLLSSLEAQAQQAHSDEDIAG